MRKSKFKFSIAVASSIAIIALGILFIASAVDIAATGGQRPYSRERVGEYLIPLIPTALITLLLGVLAVLLYRSKSVCSDERARRSTSDKLFDYSARFVGVVLPEDEGRRVLAERKKRVLINFIFFTLSLLAFAGGLIYVIFFASFTVENLNGDVLSAFTVALPLFVASAGVHIPRLYLLDSSARVEYDALLSAAKQGAKPAKPVSPKTVSGERFMKYSMRIVVLAVAVLFIALGITNGGAASVLDKAVKICTECIGLG